MSREEITQEGWYDDDIVNQDPATQKKNGVMKMRIGKGGKLEYDSSNKGDKKMKENSNNRDLLNFSVDDFMEIVADDSNWIIAEHAKNILLGESLDSISTENLGIIADIADKNKEENLYDTLYNYMIENRDDIISRHMNFKADDEIDEELSEEDSAEEHDYGHKEHASKKRKYHVPPYDYKGREEHSSQPNRIVNNHGDNPLQTNLNKVEEEIIDEKDNDSRSFDWTGMKITNTNNVNIPGDIVVVEDTEYGKVISVQWRGNNVKPSRYLVNDVLHDSKSNELYIDESDARKNHYNTKMSVDERFVEHAEQHNMLEEYKKYLKENMPESLLDEKNDLQDQ